MAISAVPFALQNVPINADVVREAVSSLVPNSGGLVQSGDFPVAQTTTPSMAVTVGVGRAWVPGNNIANLTGQTYSKQGQYFALNDASVTLSIATANATNPRIDVVYVAIQDAAYSGSTNNAVLAVVTGTPAPSPSAPAIPNNAIALANVAVAANATSIVNANITQLAVAGLPITAIPKIRASTPVAGSGTNLLSNLTNNVVTPFIQAGTFVGSTDSSGNAGITYPVAFPNGVITIMVMNGDSTTGNLIMSASGSFTQNTSTLYVHAAVANTGAAVASSTVRIDWIAIGW